MPPLDDPRPAPANTDGHVPTVVVVDDHPGMRKSLAFLIESVGYAVATHASARACLDAWRPGERGCLILDVNMPGMTGLDLLDELAQRGDCRPAIIITGFGNVPTAVRAMQAGAVDFLEKPFDDAVLLERIRQSLTLDAEWRAWQAETAATVRRLASLTPGEREILDLLVAGKPDRDIAALLGLAPGVVRARRARILDKMAVTSTLELVRRVAACARPRAGY